jgi:hypothetical protein
MSLVAMLNDKVFGSDSSDEIQSGDGNDEHLAALALT